MGRDDYSLMDGKIKIYFVFLDLYFKIQVKNNYQLNGYETINEFIYIIVKMSLIIDTHSFLEIGYLISISTIVVEKKSTSHFKSSIYKKSNFAQNLYWLRFLVNIVIIDKLILIKYLYPRISLFIIWSTHGLMGWLCLIGRILSS